MKKAIIVGFKLGIIFGVVLCLVTLATMLFSPTPTSINPIVVIFLLVNGLAASFDYFFHGNFNSITISTYFFVLLVPAAYGTLTGFIRNEIQTKKWKYRFLVLTILFYVLVNAFSGLVLGYAHALERGF